MSDEDEVTSEKIMDVPNPLPRENGFTQNFLWSNPHAGEDVLICRILTTNPNTHDLMVAIDRFGIGRLREKFELIDEAQEWPSPSMRRWALNNLDKLEKTFAVLNSNEKNRGSNEIPRP